MAARSVLVSNGLRKVRNPLVFSFILSVSALTAILNSNGDEVFAHADIERAHVDFYTRLFSEEPIDHECKQLCLASILNFLSSEQRDSCEGFLTLNELSFSVKSLNLGKSPGSDGFSTEFYLFFWDLLAPLLLRVKFLLPWWGAG